MALEKEDARLIAAELAKLTGKGGGGSNAAMGEKAGSLFDLMKSPTTAFTGTITAAGKGLDSLGKAYERIEKEMAAGIGTWRQLSNSGITFGNDIIGMGAAAAGTRMEMGEFADMVGKNSTFLAGFGGTINQGAVEFAKTSKVMFDQYGETTDRLRQMGLTNKDLNETLALQAGMIGNSMRKGEARDKIAIESATALANEMDLTAKLTGKSRQEQMEGAKKLQADAAFQIKLEQATRNMSEKEAAEYKTKITAEYTKAEALGLGQSFKETFTYGQVMSKQAANEQVMAGRAGIESAKAAQAASAGNFEKAAEHNARAMDESAKNNKDASFQNVAMLNTFGGAAGETGARLYMANKALADNIELLKKDPENKGKSDAEIRKMAIEKATKEQDASTGATKAMVNAEQRFKDAGSVIQNSLVVPIQKDLNPALNKLADTVLGARSAFIPGAREKGNIGATEGELNKGRAQYENNEAPRGSAMNAVGYQAAAISGNVGKGAEKLVDAVTPAKRSGGTYGAGKMFEDVGAILEITKPGEVVLNGEQQMNLAKGMMDKGAASAFSNLSKNLDFSKITAGMPNKMEMPKLEMPKFEMPKIPSLDLNKISQDIKTTVSGGTATTVKGPDMAELAKPFEKSFDEFGANFDDVVTRMSKEIGTAVPMDMFDEFGSNFDDVVTRMSKEIGTAMPTDMFDEFGANFDDVVAKMATDLQEAMPMDIIDQTANALEFASKRRQELEDIMNDGMARSSTEWDEIFDEAEQLDGQIEKLTNKQLDAMSKYSDSWSDTSDVMDRVYADIDSAMPIDTEFGDLEGAMKAAQERMYPDTEFGDLEGAMKRQAPEQQYKDTEFGDLDGAIKKNQANDAMQSMVQGSSPTKIDRGITMDSFTLGANGLPIAKPKSIAAAVPEKKSEKSEAEQAEEKREKMKAEIAKQSTEADKSKEGATKAAGGEKTATLDDVVKSLNALNTKMGQLISTTESGSRDVAKAAKSGSNNVYAR